MAAIFVPTALHVRNVLLYFYLSNVTASDAERNLNAVYPSHTPHRSSIFRWYARFNNGEYCLDDEHRPGRPTECDLEQLKHLVETDPFQSSRDMARLMNISHQSVCRGLHAIGKVKKLGRFIPHRLTEFDYCRRIDICTSLLTMHNDTRWLNHLITGDEKWIFFDNTVRKAQWVDVCEQPDDIPRPELHPKKVMLCIWWNIHGPIHWELLPVGTSITADLYAQQLRILKQKVDDSAFGKHKVYFQHDNARPHIARNVSAELARFGWTVLPHPPYSPDLAPSDYWLFSDMQRHFEGRNFPALNILHSALKQYLETRPQQFWADGIHKLYARWQYVVDHDGHYN